MQGLAVGMVCIRSPQHSKPDSRFLTSYATLRPNDVYSPKGIHVIQDFVRAFRPSGIISINENISRWLNDNRDQIGTGVSLWSSSNDVISQVLSKSTQIETARSVGFNVLPTYSIDQNIDSSRIIPETHFPLCLRPDNPKTVDPSFKVKLARSPDEIIHYIQGIRRLDKPLLGQPFLNLPNMVVHGARTISGRAIGIQGFLVERKFQGVTLSIRPFPLNDSVRRQCIDFANSLNLTGSYHFEFLYDTHSQDVYFLEVNNRLGGTTAKVFGCGYDEPLLALEAYDAWQPRPASVRNRVVTSRHALLKYLHSAIRSQLTPLDYPPESQSMRLLKISYAFFFYRDEIWTRRDIRGSLAFYRSLIRKRQHSSLTNFG